MRSAVRGIALLVLIAIIIFIIWCFVLGKCSGRTFGVVPPRPQTRSTGRKPTNENNEGLNVSGSGNGSAGAGGSGSGSVELTPTASAECSFWDFGCKLQRFFAEGTTFFGQKPIIPEQLRNYVKPSVLRGGR